MIAQIDNIKIFYKEIIHSKSLPTVLVLHGGLGFDHSYMMKMLVPYSGECNWIFMDLPGNGKSSKNIFDDSDYILKTLKILKKFQNFLKINKLNILGHSAGASIALLYRLRYPGSVSKAICINGVYDSFPPNSNFINESEFEKQHPQYFKKYSSLKNTNVMKSGQAFIEFMGAITPLYFHQFKEEYISFMKDIKISLKAIKFGNPLYENFHSYLEKYYNSSLSNVYFVHGVLDKVVSVNNIKYIKNNFIESNILVYKECAHFPFVEKSSKFKKDLRRILNEK
jgi:proline iminopeptidase